MVDMMVCGFVNNFFRKNLPVFFSTQNIFLSTLYVYSYPLIISILNSLSTMTASYVFPPLVYKNNSGKTVGNFFRTRV